MKEQLLKIFNSLSNEQKEVLLQVAEGIELTNFKKVIESK